LLKLKPYGNFNTIKGLPLDLAIVEKLNVAYVSSFINGFSEKIFIDFKRLGSRGTYKVSSLLTAATWYLSVSRLKLFILTPAGMIMVDILKCTDFI